MHHTCRPRFANALTCALALVLVFVSAAGAQDTGSGTPTVAVPLPDVVAPVITTVADVDSSAASGSGAVVIYPLPIATDETDGALMPSCAPASGAHFALGITPVTCSATDAAGNRSEIVAFNVVVIDDTAPVFVQPPDLTVVTDSTEGATVAFAIPVATDAVAGAITATCDLASGTLLPVGTTVVTCRAADPSANLATTTFTIVVEMASSVEPTPLPETTPDPKQTPEPARTPDPEPTETPAALPLPWPTPPLSPPIPNANGLIGLAVIWGGFNYPISQEFGQTAFALNQPTLYQYGVDFGLDGHAHPGIDVGMPRGTCLYSPVNGTVVAAGGTGGFGFYGNVSAGVGELRIETADGNHVVLGHLAAIGVGVGEAVAIGQFVGLSGGDNGDHLHLETRQKAGVGLMVIDPRESFLVPILAAYNSGSRMKVMPDLQAPAARTSIAIDQFALQATLNTVPQRKSARRHQRCPHALRRSGSHSWAIFWS